MAIEKMTAASPEVADSRWTVRPPAWEGTEPLTLAKVVAAFEHTVSFTIGVEEELMLVEPQVLDLAHVIDEVLRSSRTMPASRVRSAPRRSRSSLPSA